MGQKKLHCIPYNSTLIILSQTVIHVNKHSMNAKYTENKKTIRFRQIRPRGWFWRKEEWFVYGIYYTLYLVLCQRFSTLYCIIFKINYIFHGVGNHGFLRLSDLRLLQFSLSKRVGKVSTRKKLNQSKRRRSSCRSAERPCRGVRRGSRVRCSRRIRR